MCDEIQVNRSADPDKSKNGVAKGANGGSSKKTPPEPKKDWLGSQLRELYQSYAEEPLPGDLQSLLDQLGAQDESETRDR